MVLPALEQFGQQAQAWGDDVSQIATLAPADQMFNQYVQPMAAGITNRYVSMPTGGTDEQFGSKYVDPYYLKQQEQYGQGFDQRNSGFGDHAFGNVTNVGGAWSALDQHNNEITRAAQTFGVPPNLLKSMINRESSGNWARDNRVHYGLRNQRMLPFVGIFEDAANSWGLNFDQMIGNKQEQVNGMAKILAGLANKYGGYENAAKVYFGGEAALNGGFVDELGMDSNTYGGKAIADWKWLDSQAGYSGGYDNIPLGDGGVGTDIVGKAMEYVGVRYVWGSLPGANQDPWQTGWDCSAFVNWLDDKYGANELPAGSHYQYQDSVDKGLLYTDLNQLKAGDLIFWDTGNTAGGGANLNRAGHVSMYIGNGQMIHAANPGAGTIISSVSDYLNMYPSLGARRMGWSGGGGYTGGGGQQQQRPKFSNLLSQYLFQQ